MSTYAATISVTDLIEELWADPRNDLQRAEPERAWDRPLVGFAGGADPIFEQYKAVVGSFHWTPLEIFSLTFPQAGASAEDLVVISWVLPQTAATKREQRARTVYPSERWARSRFFGEQFNHWLRRTLAERLTSARVPTVVRMAIATLY